METITTQAHRDQIKQFIQTELLKRGFTAQIEELEEEKRRIKFHTAAFQTTPILFEEIRVENFSSGINEIETLENDYQYRRFWISVNVRYKHFGGGSNGCELFSVSGDIPVDSNDVQDLKAW